MKLTSLLKGIKYTVSADITAKEVAQIQFDSRKIKANDVFVAISGTLVDGHDFIPKALENGASVVVGTKDIEELSLPAENVAYIQVADTSEALGLMARNFFKDPSSKLDIIAITGTNGKTSTVTLLFQLFKELGYSVGLLSTVEDRINDRVIPSTHTTGDALQINQLLVEMVNEGVQYCFMEASSHAIVQNRMAGLRIKGAAFTNISHDHLDYHGTFKEYINAKKLLFDRLDKNAFALVNADDKRGNVMLQNTKAHKATFGLKSMADFKAKVIDNTFEGLLLNIDQREVWVRLTGEFNAYNILLVYGIAQLLDEDQDEVLLVLSQIKGAEGRFETVLNDKGLTALVDYAHTPDALENVLKTIHQVGTASRIITVVGCGGDRDKTKRPEMAAIACRYSDKVIFTSDKPRSEDPEQILNDMLKGIADEYLHKYIKLSDRKEAIKLAVMLAEKGDVLLVAGKGHENYQEINGVKTHFDDREVLNEFLA